MPNLFSDLIRQRTIVFSLAITDVKLRYKNSALGFFWTFLEPVLMLGILYVVFSNILRSEIEHYPMYLLIGLVFWYMFSRATTAGMTSLQDKSFIIQKTPLRREIIVISSTLTAFIMMMFELLAFGVFVIIFQFIPPLTISFLPILLLEIFILSLGIAFVLSILNVYFRDIRFIWQVTLQASFFLSPIIYTLEMFPETIRGILEINPFVHMLNITHSLVLYGTMPELNSLFYLISTTGALLIFGYYLFKLKEKKIAEKI